MNKILGLLAILLMTACSTVNYQNMSPEQMAQAAERDLKKMDKQSSKTSQDYADEVMYLKAEQALAAKDFVLEADRVDFRRGGFAYVNANTNFISLKGDKATIQLAFNTAAAGPNGIGGITVDGTASNIQVKTDNKGNITYSMMVQGAAVSANVTIRMIKGSNRCTAIVTPNFNSNRVSLTGIIYPSDESNVFKGRSF